MIRFITPLLIFIAFLLLLLCSVSTPINLSLFLFDLDANKSASFLNASVQGKVRFGLWGYCTSGFKATVLGLTHQDSADCTAVQRGFEADSRLAQLLGIDDLESVVSKTVTAVLVIHPVTCGLTFLALIITLFIAFRPSRKGSLAAVLATFLAALLALVCFLVDIIFVSVARSKITSFSSAFQVTTGNVTWMALGATLALFVATVASCLSLLRLRRNTKEKQASDDEKI